MGFKNSQFVAVKHSDRTHSHLHIVTSKIDLDGKVVNTEYDYFRSQTRIRNLELEYKIKQVPCSWEIDRRQKTRAEIHRIEKNWEKSVREHLQKTIDDIVDFQSPLTVPQLLKELSEREISHQVHYCEDGKIKGLSYNHDGISHSGTSLGKAYTFGGLQKHRSVQFNRQIEREIYQTCTIAPNTPTATIELLQERELQLQNREEIERQQQEQERIRLSEERRIQEIEAKIQQQKEEEAAQKRALEYLSRQREIERVRQEKETKRKEDLEKQRKIKANLEIIDLAPVFTPAIEYTQYEGVDINEAKSQKRLSQISQILSGKPLDPALCLETENYIITLKTNDSDRHDLSPADQLEIGFNCHNLTIERNDQVQEEILSLNYFDYNQPNLANIHIVHNALTDSDKKRLKTLQKSVDRIKAEHQKAWEKAERNLEKARIEKKLENQPYTGDLNRVKEAVVKILSHKGQKSRTGKIELGFKNKKFLMAWKETFNYQAQTYQQELTVFQRHNEPDSTKKLIFKLTDSSHQSCDKVTDPDWQITLHDLSELNAKRLRDLDREIIKDRQTEDFQHQVEMLTISLGERGKQSQHSSYENNRYRIKIDRNFVKVWSNSDDRGLIYQVENSKDPQRFQNAVVNFSQKDYKWFKTVNEQIDAKRSEAEHQYWIEKQQEREAQRELGGGGLEL